MRAIKIIGETRTAVKKALSKIVKDYLLRRCFTKRKEESKMKGRVLKHQKKAVEVQQFPQISILLKK